MQIVRLSYFVFEKVCFITMFLRIVAQSNKLEACFTTRAKKQAESLFYYKSKETSWKLVLLQEQRNKMEACFTIRAN